MPLLDASPIDCFLQALFERDTLTSQRPRRWQANDLLSSEMASCSTCGLTPAPSGPSHLYVVELVPQRIGGPDTSTNRCVMCAKCAKRRGSGDVLEPHFLATLPGPLDEDLISRRRDVLLRSANHLTEHGPYVSKEKHEATLTARYAHPRFRVFAHGSHLGCFIGFRKRTGQPEAYSQVSVLLRTVYLGTLHETEDFIVFQVPEEKFLEAIWTLISLNGLCHSVALGSQKSSWERINGEDWRKVWSEIFDHLGENRRRFRRGEGRIAWKPREYSDNPATIRSRRRSTRKMRELATREHDIKRGMELLDLLDTWRETGLGPTRAMKDKQRLDAQWLISGQVERALMRVKFPNYRPPSGSIDD